MLKEAGYGKATAVWIPENAFTNVILTQYTIIEADQRQSTDLVPTVRKYVEISAQSSPFDPNNQKLSILSTIF